MTETAAWGPPKIVLDALDGVPAFDESATLRECTRMVGRRLGTTIALPDSARRRTYLSSLLMAVLEYPNGLQILGAVVELLEGDTRHADRVRTAIAVAEVPLFSAKQWTRLMALIGGLDVPDVADVYQEVTRYRADPPPAHCTEPWLAVVHAATLNARPGEPLPCVLLVERLARYAKDQQRQDLLDWVTEHSARPEEPVDPRRESAGGAAAAPPPLQIVDRETVWEPGACLLIRLRPLPDPDHDRERLLSFWRRLGGPDPYPVRGGDLRIDVDDLPRHVQSLVEQAETGWAYFCKEELTLEFLLPRELLHLPVERWAKRGFHGASGTIGEDHPVLLRSLERMERTDTHGRWRRRWDDFIEGCAGPVHWFPDDGRARLLTDPPPAVVVLSGPPRRLGEGEAGVDELGESLRAGVPIVVWDRRGGTDPVFRDELAELMAQNGIRRLPDAVRSLRIDAKDEDATEGDSSTLGRHVALLWDDPYRRPGGRGDMAEPSAQRGRTGRDAS
ncbi:hypothetical protein [Streptomyces sp. NPDC020965]|uniref:VMAP-C domain-containing protein n=1 Tax=Streptomyces sp. NPDC020965 TaxID=3365105 RepID=UPI0037B20292